MTCPFMEARRCNPCVGAVAAARRGLRRRCTAVAAADEAQQLASTQRGCRSCFEKKQLRARFSQRSCDVLPVLPQGVPEWRRQPQTCPDPKPRAARL